MSVRLVPIVGINALATFAKQELIRGVERYSAEGVAWALFQANLASLRAHYGDRLSNLLPELPQIERAFRYEAVDLDAKALLKHLLDVIYNSISHDGCFEADAWRICQRLGVWIVLRANLEAEPTGTVGVAKLDPLTTRYLRSQAARLYGAPRRREHHVVRNQPDLFKRGRTDRVGSSQPEPADPPRPQDLN